MEYDIQNNSFNWHQSYFYDTHGDGSGTRIWGASTFYSQINETTLIYSDGSHVYVVDMTVRNVTEQRSSSRPGESPSQSDTCVSTSETPSPRVYITGGFPNFQVLDLDNMQWMSNLPETQDGHGQCACTALNSTLWVFGVGSIETLNISNITSNTSETWQYGPNNYPLNCLGSIHDLYQPGLFTVGNFIFVIGGSCYHEDPSDAVHIIDTITGNITLHEHFLPYPLRAMPVAVIGNTVYIFGGDRYNNQSMFLLDSWLTLDMFCEFTLYQSLGIFTLKYYCSSTEPI